MTRSTLATLTAFTALHGTYAARILTWSPPGTDPIILNGTLSAVLAGTGSSLADVTVASAAADLCAGLETGATEWLVVPSFLTLPLGRYWGPDVAATSRANASVDDCAISSLPKYLRRGGKWLAAPGAPPIGWFNDIPATDDFSVNVFSPYEVYQAPAMSSLAPASAAVASCALNTLAALHANVTSAVAFARDGAAVFTPAIAAVDAAGRTRAWAAASLAFPSGGGGLFPGSCWVLLGVTAPAEVYIAPAWQDEVAAMVTACQAKVEGAPAPSDSCPCPARGSAATPLLPRLSLSEVGACRRGTARHLTASLPQDRRHWTFPNGSLWFALGADSFRDSSVGLSLTSISRIFADAAASGASAMRLYQWPVNASDPMWACALDCATASGIYVLPVIDGNTAWETATDLQAHARFIATQVRRAGSIRSAVAYIACYRVCLSGC